MKKVLCIAEVCCDMIFAGMPRIPRLKEEIYCDTFIVKPGGGANTPMSLSLLGGDVTMFTALGDDDMGRSIGLILEKAGVKLAGQRYRPGTRTAVSAVMSTDTDRCFASFGGCGGMDWQGLEEAVRNADIVQTYLGYCWNAPVAALCRQYGKTLCVDANWIDVQNQGLARQLLPQTDYLKLNEEEARILTGCETGEEALQALADRVRQGVIITLGGRGSVGMENGVRYAVPAVSMGEFRDACGAGDNFAAGFLYGISGGKTFREAMELGARLAGLAVTWYGGNDEELNCTKIDPLFQ